MNNNDFTSQQLEAMSTQELQDVAKSLGVQLSDDHNAMLNAILDARTKSTATTGRRQRIVRKEVNRVFTSEDKPAGKRKRVSAKHVTETIMVPKFGINQNIRKIELAHEALAAITQTDGEAQSDTAPITEPVATDVTATAPELVAPESPAATPVPEVDAATTAEPPTAAPPKRKRGRPSKAELAAREAERLAAEQAKLQAEDNTQVEDNIQAEDNTQVEDNMQAEDNTQDKQQAEDNTQATASAVVAEESETYDEPTANRELSAQLSAFNPSSKQGDEYATDGNAVPEYDNAMTDSEVLPTEETQIPQEDDIPKRLIVESDDFIITKDIPMLPAEEIVLESLPEESRRPYEDKTQGDDRLLGEVPKFRRFKDDIQVQNTTVSPATAAPRANYTPAPTVTRDILLDGSGVLELANEGFGYLRSADYNYLASPDDIYVSNYVIKQYGLRPGDVVQGRIRVPRDAEKYYVLTEVCTINGLLPATCRNRLAFEHLTPLFPDEQFKLSQSKDASHACRIVDLFAPIGKGQRALIVAQPKTGKTMLLKDIANAIAANYPETYLMMLLIDERPEEVTDMARTVKAEVIASTFDEPAARHVKIAGIVLEKAKRLVECGRDVVIFLDSITRLARAYNTVAPASGKILSGGVDANALQKPKRFFGAARNIEGGGSLTIIATALIDTGSRMDEVIFEEFKGTGNMELQLERTVANKRIFPSVNLMASSTRRDDLLQDTKTVNRMYVVRNHIAEMTPAESMEFMKKQMDDTRDNEEFLMSISN